MLRSSSCINEFDVVSLDIFDTLIERVMTVPQKVFVIVGNRVLGDVRGQQFCRDRVAAERRARSLSPSGEVTLTEIYNTLTGYDEERTRLMAEELSVELESCRAKSRGQNIFRSAKQKGKRVILVSDMYLPHSALTDMLRKCGVVNFDRLYVSCEHGCSKRSGLLFKHVLESEGVSADRMVHVGDDYVADVKGAGSNGVASVWVIDFRCVKSKIMQKLGWGYENT